MNRRDLLKGSLAASAAGAAKAAAPASPAAPSDRIGVGLIGCGGMGRMNLEDFIRTGEVDAVAVCDVWGTNLAKGQKVAGGKARTYRDYRKLLEDPDIDAVIIGTPDHWHALTSIHACEAGKDVYVEKPISHNIREGRLMVEAAREHQRVVQVGLQQRSGTHFQRAVKMVQNGELGDVHFIQCWNHELVGSPKAMGTPPDSNPPADLDWDFWLGPAPKIPFNKNRFGGTFRWFYDYGGGKLTDWGSHLLDIVLWAMQKKGPTSAAASGGKLYVTDNRDTPDTLSVIYEFPGFLLQYTTMLHNTFGHNGEAGWKPFGSYGIQFHGRSASLFVDRAGYAVTPQAEPHSDPQGRGVRDMDDLTGLSMYYTSEGPAGRGTSSLQHYPHVQNFLECVRTRQRPIADIEHGHATTAACHIGNIAFKVGQKIQWDPEAEKITNIPEANKYLTRPYRAPWRLKGIDV